MKRTLHMLMSADPRAVADCLLFARPGDRVLLVGRGVDLLATAAFDPGSSGLEALAPAALELDLAALGLVQQAKQAGLESWSDEAWVAQVCAADRVMSWR